MSKTLLLADDSVTIQKVVGISFASEDIRLITVDNGDDAIARAREERPDIILADVVMPGKNGYEVCEAIKADADLAQIPVLLLTGTFEAFDEDRASAAGADGHITKPFEAQSLVDAVNDRLSAAQGESAAPAPSPLGLTDVEEVAGAAGFDFLEDDNTAPSGLGPDTGSERDHLLGGASEDATMLVGNELAPDAPTAASAFHFEESGALDVDPQPVASSGDSGSDPLAEPLHAPADAGTVLLDEPAASPDPAFDDAFAATPDAAPALPPSADDGFDLGTEDAFSSPADPRDDFDTSEPLGGPADSLDAPSTAVDPLEQSSGEIARFEDTPSVPDFGPTRDAADASEDAATRIVFSGEDAADGEAPASDDPFADFATVGETPAQAQLDPLGARDYDVSSSDLGGELLSSDLGGELISSNDASFDAPAAAFETPEADVPPSRPILGVPSESSETPDAGSNADDASFDPVGSHTPEAEDDPFALPPSAAAEDDHSSAAAEDADAFALPTPPESDPFALPAPPEEDPFALPAADPASEALEIADRDDSFGAPATDEGSFDTGPPADAFGATATEAEAWPAEPSGAATSWNAPDPAASDPGPFAAPVAAETALTEEPVLDAPFEAPATPGDSGAGLSTEMRSQVHDALEKIAWEAFGDVAERIVQEALERVEQVAWDVIPRMAEALIQEEIRRMKGDEPE